MDLDSEFACAGVSRAVSVPVHTLALSVYYGEEDSERDSFLAQSNRDDLGMTPSMQYKGGGTS